MLSDADVRLIIELAGVAVTIGTILWRLGVATTTFTLIGQQQAQEIKDMKVAMEKMENAIALIAVQDVKITALIERMNTTDIRIDQRFTRVENLVDDLRHGKGLVKNT
jgi:hypothetical protein